MNIPKFRAWFIAEKCMVDVDSIDFVNSIFLYREDIYQYDAELSEVILMQSTGLRSKNGVEIFEGDILSHKSFRGLVEVTHSQLGGFTFGYVEKTDRYYNIEGNIHANKELLNDNM